ncbi:unnamed protein product [Triticum turgidum subsp. durum]|uniref:Transducin/WD40 repeat-like superfamily protein n=1 Tax=Triticum turgidum subsp. durum TaxID=4567 RepID=A0A9R0RLJ4_TRITD|nr:unnamed protein product [Triticum turgidum subsp. durum]
MLRLRAFRPTSDKVVKIQLHPTHPWLVTADANDRVSVWDWEHRQVIYELKAGGVDERRLVGVKLEKLAEGETDSKGKPTEAIRGGSMEFLSRSSSSDAPLVAFGASDGVIRVLSMMTWKLVRRYTGGHKGAISCLMTFMSAAGEVHLVSGGSDGLLVLWSADHIHDSRELVPKISLKAHDGGVVAVELSRVMGSAPQLITIGADKTLAIWDTVTFKEIRRIKPVPKLACHSVASWCHPRAPNLDILTCVKDSHIWAIEHPTYSALTRPLCELSSLVPPQALAQHKKLRVYCMVAHPLQPHLVATGTNIGIILSEFDPRALPAVAPLPALTESKEHSAVYIVERELKLLNFQLSNTANPSLGSASEAGRSRSESIDQLIVKQSKKHISTPAPHDSYSILSASSSGKYVAVVWPDIPSFVVYKASDWSVVDSGTGKLFAWDSCRDRYALVESALAPRMPLIVKGGSSKKAKEAAAAAAQAAAAAASAASSATVQVRILLDDGTAHVLQRSIDGRSEPVVGLHGGALLGVTYRTSRRISPLTATAISTVQSMPLSGFGGSGSSFASDDPFSSREGPPQNFQLYSWETYQPVSGLLAQPEWTVWDQTVEYCAFAYQQYIVISSLRPQFRYLGDVSIPSATGAVWHRRQLFVATPTTIECVFVDAGVAAIDIETKKRKEEMKAREAQGRAVADHGDLALITVEGPQVTASEKISLRPPMLQQYAREPRFYLLQGPPDTDNTSWVAPSPHLRAAEGGGLRRWRRTGGGLTWTAAVQFGRRPTVLCCGGEDEEEEAHGVVVVRLASFQHAPSIPPFIVPKQSKLNGDDSVFLKELDDRRYSEVAVAGGGVSVAVTRFPPEQKRPIGPLVLVGVRDGVLWLVDRLEFDLAMQSKDLKRALACLLTMSNSRDVGQETTATDVTQILNLAVAKQAKQESLADAVQGIVKFVKEFFDLIDAADATGQAEIAREVLKRLAAAASVKGALHGQTLRGLALRLANHGELTRLSGLVANLITAGHGCEAAFAAAVLGDNALMEKAWQDTGMLAEAVLHAQHPSYLSEHGILCTVIALHNACVYIHTFYCQQAFSSSRWILQREDIRRAAQQQGSVFWGRHMSRVYTVQKAVADSYWYWSSSHELVPAHGRPSLRSSVITWNKMLQKELDHMPTVKTDAAAAFLASLEDPKLTSLGETEKKPPIEILPPGMPPLSAPPIIIKKAAAKPGLPNAAQTPGAPMNQGTPMAQGTPMNQSTPMAQGTPVAQGAPMAQAPPALAQSTDEVKPLEATTAPDNVEATAATSNAEATAAPVICRQRMLYDSWEECRQVNNEPHTCLPRIGRACSSVKVVSNS